MQSKLFNTPRINILLFFIIIALASCKNDTVVNLPYPITKSIVADSAVVVTAHPLASIVGKDILKIGGNAIDAAIAVQFALAVCYPGAGNIGGGGFMVYREPSGHTTTLDYREKAPTKATTDMYLDHQGNPIDSLSKFGPLASGVPGTVDGMIQAFKKYSKLKDWKKLLQPAIELASKGFQITQREADHLNESQALFEINNRFKTSFQKKMWKQGDVLIQSDLAATLTRIGDNGRDGFYSGITAQLIVDEMNTRGGIITLEDLKGYQSVWRDPIAFEYRDYHIISMPPPSSGGIALEQLFKMIAPYDVKSLQFQSAAAVHLMTEAERRVYADRAYYLGDPDFVHIPYKSLVDSLYIEKRMADFNPRQASKSSNITHGLIESEETTHYCIVDQAGNAVSMTTTLNGSYGSYTVVKGAGFLLNNEMDDFSVKPGTPNLYGLVGAEANKIEPRKRMLSSMTPTIVTKNNKLAIVVGTPGGSTIITSVFQTLVNVIDFEMNIDQAVQSPRFHHQWLPDAIMCEKDAIATKERRILESIGHKLKDRESIGRVEGIFITQDSKIHGAADRRGDDSVQGF
jgi:gamma-glutamyltranspeptidase/glutathione hydrolase